MACFLFPLFDGRAVYLQVLHHAVFYHSLVKGILLVLHVAVLEREIREAVFVRLAHVEEILAVHLYIAQCYVVACGERHVVALFGLEELRPRTHHEETVAVSREVFHRHVLIMLRRVRTHFEPQHTVCLSHGTPAQDYITVVQALAAESEASVHLAVCTVLDDDVRARAVVRIFVRPSSLSAFEHHRVIAHAHVASVYEYVLAHVEVYRVGAGGTALRVYRRHSAVGRVNIAAEIAHILALIQVVRPERAVDEAHILHGDVLAV